MFNKICTIDCFFEKTDQLKHFFKIIHQKRLHFIYYFLQNQTYPMKPFARKMQLNRIQILKGW